MFWTTSISQQNVQLSPIACFGVSKQATHRRPGDEPFLVLGSNVHDWGGMAKNGPFWTKNGQIWQACQRSKVIQKGRKRTKIVNLSVCDHFAPLWTHRDPFWPFQTKNDFLLQSTLAKPYFVHLGQQIHFCMKWPKRVQMDPKGSQMVKNHSGRPFWSLLEYFVQACHFWSIMDHFLADPSQEWWTYPSLLWLAELK